MSAAFWEMRRNWITSCADQDAEHGLLDNPNRIDGMDLALEIILLWINREAQNKHFNPLAANIFEKLAKNDIWCYFGLI